MTWRDSPYDGVFSITTPPACRAIASPAQSRLFTIVQPELCHLTNTSPLDLQTYYHIFMFWPYSHLIDDIRELRGLTVRKMTLLDWIIETCVRTLRIRPLLTCTARHTAVIYSNIPNIHLSMSVIHRVLRMQSGYRHSAAHSGHGSRQRTQRAASTANSTGTQPRTPPEDSCSA